MRFSIVRGNACWVKLQRGEEVASPVSCDASVQARDRERREQQAVFLGYLGHRHISAAITQVLHRFRPLLSLL